MEFDGEYHDYLCDLGELLHKPIDGPRADHVGENVFAFEWAAMMEIQRELHDPPNAPLARILYDMHRRISQRHASVAASFIVWLGTNCGNALIQKARRLYRDHDYSALTLEESFLCAWSIENIRRPGSTRLIDAILAPVDHWGPDLFSGHWGLRRAPDLSAEDFETIEHVAYWCGSDQGCHFIRRCDYLIRMRESYSVPESIKIIAGVATARSDLPSINGSKDPGLAA